MKWFHQKVTSQASGIQTVATPQQLAAIMQYYNRIDHRYTGEVEASIRQAASLVPQAERETYLYRGLTVAFIYFQLEVTWWNIFGSQIKALQELNNGQKTREQLFPLYVEAAQAWPNQYDSYSFDKWLGYLRSQILLRDDNDLLGITIKGKDFLRYLVDDSKLVNDKIL